MSTYAMSAADPEAVLTMMTRAAKRRSLNDRTTAPSKTRDAQKTKSTDATQREGTRNQARGDGHMTDSRVEQRHTIHRGARAVARLRHRMHAPVQKIASCLAT